MNNSANVDQSSVDDVLEKFESLWETGPEPDLQDFLNRHGLLNAGDSSKHLLLGEILSIDLERRFRSRSANEIPVLTRQYLTWFPDLDPAVVRELVLTEWRLRNEAGFTLSAGEFVGQIEGLQPPVADQLIQELIHLPTIPVGASHADKHFQTAAANRGIPESIGPYPILRKLGEGGMGEVWLARNLTLNRDVAVKVIRKSRIADDAELREMMQNRFLVEAQAAGRLEHPNIVRVHSIGQDDDELYYEMEYVDGTSLRKWKPASAAEIAALVRDVALAVHYAHSRAIIHRDLKPENILLTKDGTVKITDFGLAKITDATTNLTRDNMGMGTPNYMSPEQFTDVASVTTATDIYAIGIILYELLEGRAPFHFSGEMQSFIDRVRKEEPTPPAGSGNRVPRNLQTVCLKCLAKEPSRRYSSASQLAADLTCFLEDRPVSARRITPPERFWLMCRRNPVTATLISLICCGMVVFLVALWNLEQEARGQARVALAAVNDFFIQVYNNNAFRQPGLRALRNDLNARAVRLQSEIDFDRLGRAGEDGRIFATARFLAALRETESGADSQKARELLDQAQTILQSLLSVNHNDHYVLGTLGDVCVEKGRICQRMSPPDFKTAEVCYLQARDHRQRLLELDSQNADHRRKLASVIMNLGALAEETVNVTGTEEAKDADRAALEAAYQYLTDAITLRGEKSTNQLSFDYAQNLFNIGNVQRRLKGHTAASIHYEQAADICRKLIEENPWDIDTRRLLIKCLYEILPAEAVVTEDSARKISRLSAEASHNAAVLVEFDPYTARTSPFLVSVHTDFAGFLMGQRDFEAAGREIQLGTKSLKLVGIPEYFDETSDNPAMSLMLLSLQFAAKSLECGNHYIAEPLPDSPQTDASQIVPTLSPADRHFQKADEAISVFAQSFSDPRTSPPHREYYFQLNQALQDSRRRLSELRKSRPGLRSNDSGSP